MIRAEISYFHIKSLDRHFKDFFNNFFGMVFVSPVEHITNPFLKTKNKI